MLSSSILLALAAISFVPSLAQTTINKCPTKETTVVDTQSKIWAICLNSDYQGNTAQIFSQVTSVNDCQKKCANVTGCTKGVFDHIYNYCHVKGDGLTWTTSTQFDSMRLVSNIQDGTAIDKCPTTEVTVTDGQGRTWAICEYSDYQGPSTQVLQNINSNADCQQQCAATNTCIKAVFDRNANLCHIKGNGLTWVASSRYDSARLVSGGSSGSSQIPSAWRCDSQQSVVTTTDGSTFALCTNTDWQGGSTYVLNNYQTSQACAEMCSLTAVCKNAIWDKNNKVCHVKTAENQLTQADNNQFDQLRLIKKADPISQSAKNGGKWSDKITFPIVPAAAYLVPQQPYASRIMAFSANADESFGTQTGLTQFADWNYQSGAISKRTVQNTNHDMFCPGISTLQNGKIIVTGGSDASDVSIYDPASNQFVRAPDMKLGRGYQSSVTLSNGKVFTIGGSFSGGIQTKNGEVYDPSANSWTMLDGCKADALNTRDSTWRRDNHAWLYGWTDGSVFQAGPSGQMNWYRTAGTGSTSSAGVRNSTADAMCGINVMFDTGKILYAGGAPLYDDNAGTTTAQIINVPSVGSSATAKNVPDMKYPRTFANSVVLPDGSVLVTGGQKYARQFTDIEAILYPELFNPKTNTWTVMNAASVGRNYHSVSLLLGDGRVFVGGGGLCYVANGAPENSWGCDPSAQHMDAEIFSPPYLFNADGSAATRPSITGLVTSNDGNGNWVRAGGTLTATLDSNNAMTFSVIRLGSATHSINTDQRRLSLTATQNGNKYTIKLPSDGGVLLPGYWFLFALNAQGTPSIGRVIQVVM